MRYPSEQLAEEVAYLAYYFHWPYDQIMQLEHAERRAWVAELGRMHTRLNEGAAYARGG